MRDAEGQKVVVIGQGYVGLPVAMRAAQVGFRVVGLDIDARRIGELRNGHSYVGDISSRELQDALEAGVFTPTTSYDEASDFDVAVITVPTPLRESLPDLSFIEFAAKDLAPYVRAGSIVILESTTYPGTTEELLIPLLESGSGLVAGVDFHVGYSPERIDPGNKKYGFVETPKVVSGINETSLKAVKDFYDSLVETTVPVSGTREAELTKLLENTFRHVNIALVNELAVFAHQLGINIWESIDAASSKPFGYMRFTPGPGVGGHCLPVDPSYLSWQVRKELGQNFRFVELANDVNEHMPNYVVQRLTSLLNDASKPVRGSVILLVGLSYKKNTGDIREAPSLRIIELLHQLGATVLGHDGFVEDYDIPDGVRMVSLSREVLETCDAALLLTDHDGSDYSLLEDSICPILDTRNLLSGQSVERL
ncbi:nucleotide sugar dehydrogenase [Arthrobacter crystallopoietes]|uniref:nucleotide sugar dehydrogenase n=1 Tax=Crystallibacter crystallopoietes TaxID=37928 RepID=UPI0011112F4A|nr:nucleotide sugar dehydrogenase [Arthrobacter crystallopoietes]